MNSLHGKWIFEKYNFDFDFSVLTGMSESLDETSLDSQL